MKEDKSKLISRAMTYGFIMGLIWSVKYLFFIFSFQVHALGRVYWGCTLAVPYIAYIFTKRYRNEIGGAISFFHAWRFGLMTYSFAALIVALPHFIFYEFIAPDDFIANAFKQTVDMFKEADMTNIADMTSAIKSINLSPIHMAVQQIFNNIFYGILFSLPVAALLKRPATITES